MAEDSRGGSRGEACDRRKFTGWRPSFVGMCAHCGRRSYRAAESCGRRSCPGYVDLWLGDQRMRLLQNLRAFPGKVVMTTITAPSIAWDPAACVVNDPHTCSGKLGCRSRADLADWWNGNAERAFQALHKAAMMQTQRRFGSGVLKRLAYAPELQARGLLHWHMVLAYETPAQRWSSIFYVRTLSRLAELYGFGFVDRGKQKRGVRQLKAQHAMAAASYLSKYLTKGDANGLRAMVLAGKAPQRPVYVHRELTAETRVITRNLRRRRYLWFAWKQDVPCDEAEFVFDLLAAFNGQVIPYAPGVDGAEATPNAPPVSARTP